MKYSSLTFLVLLPLQILAQQARSPICPIVFDGRVPPIVEITDFDIPTDTPYSSLRPPNIKWSSSLSFPRILPSVFDRPYGGKAIEVSITDQSIVQVGKVRQTGLRRSELIVNDTKTGDQKAYHWSVRQGKQLDLNHEYANVFLEKAGKSTTNTFVLTAGNWKGTKTDDFKVLNSEGRMIWQTQMLQNEWQNFAMLLDHDKDTIKVYYSRGDAVLAPVTKDLKNDNSEGGYLHIGVLKKSIAAKDPQRNGIQPNDIHESQIYGGVFIENAMKKCVSV
ncbi:hypothetical protein EJ08DRAFT_226607 [Tothia fuscella]|uniref:Glycoside hydrolase 131 catalytic N-terminal domain-containing protein n=1 Tax=Tothia fuscella TaxID=1048955 RepID=A0A9P4U2T8_9PEZI|nr:hypothetical protein EJ08DRAFT_226607 [Tothia fuscella]